MAGAGRRDGWQRLHRAGDRSTADRARLAGAGPDPAQRPRPRASRGRARFVGPSRTRRPGRGWSPAPRPWCTARAWSPHPTPRRFALVNVVGAARLMRAAARATAHPASFCSHRWRRASLRCRAYAESKRRAKTRSRRTAGDHIELCILRPPAVYGPGDRATLPIFRQLQPRPAVRAGCAGRAVFADLHRRPRRIGHSAARRTELGWSCPRARRRPAWRLSLAGSGRDRRSAAGSTGAHGRAFPNAALAGRGGRQLVGAALGRPPPFSLGKLRELFHPDWVCRALARADLGRLVWHTRHSNAASHGPWHGMSATNGSDAAVRGPRLGQMRRERMPWLVGGRDRIEMS